MKMIFVVFSLVLGACVHQQPLSENRPAASALTPNLSLVAGCRVLSLDGVVKKGYQGARCLFFDDGSYLSGLSRSLTYFDRFQRVVWKKTIHTHHILTKTQAGNFLVGSSDIHQWRGKRVRFDVLLLLNREGKELARFSIYDHVAEILRADPDLPEYPLRRFDWDVESSLKVKFEFSHLNSYYEVPPFAGSPVAGIEPGDIITNTTGLKDQVIVVDHTLQSIHVVHSLRPREDRVAPLHDVQMLPTGKILAYDNRAGFASAVQTYSSIDEIDPQNWKLVWQFVDKPPMNFASPIEGGVQRLENGDTLFSDITGDVARVRIVDKNGHGKFTLPLQLGPFDGLQDAKLIDLTKFLENNVAL